MVLRFYNTFTGKKENFQPLEKSKVKIYTCGPTVYDFAHIGNFRTYIFQDLLRRWLKYKGYNVYQVMNLTDVDDKTIRNSRSQGLTLREYTEKYVKAFFEDIDILNIERAEVYPKATEHIKDMVELIKRLMEKNFAYRGKDDSIYFDISKFERYGKLSKLKTQNLRIGMQVEADEYEKEEARDFALWKAWTEEDGDVFWETEIGKGRPGWHIECSAMAMKHLGETLDIHSGGKDLIFPHHENEIAQSEASTDKKFVNYWLHSEHLTVDGRKMAKSLGNFYTLKDLLKMGYNPRAIRYILISTHYRQPLNFTFKSLKAAEKTLSGLKEFISQVKLAEGESPDTDIDQLILETKTKFENAMDDDLNINIALASIFQLIKKVNMLNVEGKLSKSGGEKIYNFFMEINNVLGIFEKSEPEKLPEEVETLTRERWKARIDKDWKTSDEIRETLDRLGFKIEDTPLGATLKLKSNPSKVWIIKLKDN